MSEKAKILYKYKVYDKKQNFPNNKTTEIITRRYQEKKELQTLNFNIGE